LDQPKLKEQGVLRVDPFYATYYLSFNTRKSPFTDVRVRRAIAAATQPREIIAALGSDDVPARSLVPVGLEGFEKYVDQPSGPSEIEVAWVKQSVGAKKVVAGYDANSRNSLILQKLQNDFKQKLGLTLELQSMDWKAYLQMLGTDAPALFRFGWLAPFKDPIVFFKAFQTGNPNNYTGWSNPRYDSIVSELEIQKPESERRRELLAEAQKILIEQDAVVVPLYHYMQVHAIGPRVRNFRTNSFGVVRYDELELVRTAK
jgi:oligopeptide transport system substrate-binding protein